MKIVIVSGYWNPLHVGHLEFFEQAKKLGDVLIAITNNDEQVKLKGSIPFMNEFERNMIVSSLRCVNGTVLSIDTDLSVCKTLEWIISHYRKTTKFIFVNGGDVTIDNVREKDICKKLGIKIVCGVGGDKIQSSSSLLKNILTMPLKDDIR